MSNKNIVGKKKSVKGLPARPVHKAPPQSGHPSVTRRERLDWLHAEDREKELARLEEINRRNSR